MDRIKKILVAVDFSPCSAAALRQATRISKQNQASLAALHVARVPIYPIADGIFLPIELPPVDHLLADAREQWAKWPAAREAGANCTFEAVLGLPRAELLERTCRGEIDLLVIGAHSDHDTHKGIGSVASACVQRAATKVLVVREDRNEPFQSIVACIDFSETSQIVLEQAIRVAAQNDAALHILHVYSDPWGGKGEPEAIKENLPNIAKRYQQAIGEHLRTFCKPLLHETRALKATFSAVQNDGHGRGIIQYALQHRCDLVVLGTRAKWNARDFFWGSTAERVVQDAPCSVLTIKPPGFAQPQ